jgi:dTDP-4-amino-4,6-dideoxygalactose transaminase
MKVPLLDLKAQFEGIRAEVKLAVDDVLESTRYIMGPKVTELEEKVAEYCGAKFAVGVSSGTDALLISLMALDVKPGDLVLTTPYSFFATAGVIARLNAVPVFVDINPDTYNINPEKIREWFAANHAKIDKVKAIIPVHLYGQCADMDPILEIAGQYGIPVVEDAAQAIGARYPLKQGVKRAGSMGAMGCFSFFPSKNLGGIGDGGMVTTNNKELSEKLVKLRNHGSQPKYYHAMIGGNFRLDSIQAAVLLVKLKHLDGWHAGRQRNAVFYDQHWTNPLLKKPVIAYQREFHIYNQYILSVPAKRDELVKYLHKNDIGCEVYYPVPFHQQECFQYLGYKTGDFPISEYAAEHIIALPIYPELTDEMKAYVVKKIEDFYA